MMEKEIMDSYERMEPGEDARKRMLKNIQALAAEDQANGKEGNGMKFKSKKVVGVAAAAAIVLGVSTISYASGIFKLNSVGIGRETLEDYRGEKDVEVDMISLQGLSGSPEHKACMEWKEFSETYDADRAILSKIGNNPTGFEEEYGEYCCYTQEMADKIDEICQKYKLAKLTGFQQAKNEKSLCKKVGIEGKICGPETEDVEHTYLASYYYADGSFHLEGTAVLKGQKDITADYQFIRYVKGTFSDSTLNVGDINDYEQWEYVTKSGQKVLLANSKQKALIMVEKEKSFIVVNILGDILRDTFVVDNDGLEALADSFDFSAIP